MRPALFALVLLIGTSSVRPLPVTAQDKDSFEAACASGEQSACNVLGLIYETGSGTGTDLARARDIYRQSCDAGSSAGCTSLGLMLEHGSGVPEDPDGAGDLYDRACTAGDQFGCDLLAALRHEGPITEPQEFFKTGRVGNSKSAVMLSNALVDVPQLGVKALTDQDGRISLGRVQEGYYDVRAEALGYEVMRGVIMVPGYSEFLVLLEPLGPATSTEPGRILGTVTDETGRGISDVEVALVAERSARTLTDMDGHFQLTRVAPGVAHVELSRLGYAKRETMLIVQAGGDARIDATMSTEAVDLDPIEVTVEERSAYLTRSGFYRRQRMGFGRHLTLDDFHGQGRTVGELIREIPGFRVVTDVFRREFVYSTRASSSCQLDSYVDGGRTRDGNVNWAEREEIAGIELYRGQEVPSEYSRVGNCGVILIWTKRP